MPIDNDSESRSYDSKPLSVEPEAEPVDTPEENVNILPATQVSGRVCERCREELLPYRYRGVYGWSHAEKPCDPLTEQWDRWSLEWAGRINPTNGGIGWTANDGTGGYRPERYVDAGGCRVLIRSGSPARGDDVVSLESLYGPRVIWLWEAAPKAIFLTSDGYLRVNGKGTVISAATMPVILDFGPGFMTRDGFVSQVAHVLEHKLINNNLYIKFRWLTYEAFIKELYECQDKFFGSKGSSLISTTSSEPLATVGSVLPP